LRVAFRENWTRLFGGAQHVRLATSAFENMDQAQLTDALRTEYLHLQKTVEDFDSKALTIKAWSVTFSLAVLVGAFTSHSKLVVLVAAIASALFWVPRDPVEVVSAGLLQPDRGHRNSLPWDV
jgi:hypothetical protein